MRNDEWEMAGGEWGSRNLENVRREARGERRKTKGANSSYLSVRGGQRPTRPSRRARRDCFVVSLLAVTPCPRDCHGLRPRSDMKTVIARRPKADAAIRMPTARLLPPRRRYAPPRGWLVSLLAVTAYPRDCHGSRRSALTGMTRQSPSRTSVCRHDAAPWRHRRT